MASFSELLAKIAKNETLTPMEIDELKRFGTDTQQRNSFVAGIIDGTATFPSGINVNGDIRVGNTIFSPTSCRMKRNTSQVIPGETTTVIELNEIEYNDGMYIDLSTYRITIPITGIYKVFIGAVISEYNPGGGQISVYKNNGAEYPGFFITNTGVYSAYDERAYTAGDYIELRATIGGGGTIATVFIGTGLIRSSTG